MEALPPTTPDTFSDEQQIASYKLLLTYVDQLGAAWRQYLGRRQDAFTAYPLFTERLARASQMLSVIAQANVNFMSAMDAVGFPEAERRSSASRFEYLDSAISYGMTGVSSLPALVSGTLKYSTMTVYDFIAWVEKLARYDGPRYLTDSGQVGLEFVTSQADKLFCTIAPVLYFALTSANHPLAIRAVRAQEAAYRFRDVALSDSGVRRGMDFQRRGDARGPGHAPATPDVHAGELAR